MKEKAQHRRQGDETAIPPDATHQSGCDFFGLDRANQTGDARDALGKQRAGRGLAADIAARVYNLALQPAVPSHEAP